MCNRLYRALVRLVRWLAYRREQWDSDVGNDLCSRRADARAARAAHENLIAHGPLIRRHEPPTVDAFLYEENASRARLGMMPLTSVR